MISSAKFASSQTTARTALLTVALLLVAMVPLSFAAKACKLSYKQLPNMSGSYKVKGTEMDTDLDKQTPYTYSQFKASKKGAYVVFKTKEVNEDGDKVTVTGAWQPLTSARGRFLGYQYLGVDSDEEDDRYFITPTKLSSSCKVLKFTMTVFHELDDLCEPDDRQADEETTPEEEDEENCSKLSYVHNVGQYFGTLE